MTPRAPTSPRPASSVASSATTGSRRVPERSSPRLPSGPGHLDEARALLVKLVDASEAVELSIQSVTFSLVASAELALAQGNARQAASALGAADGLRQRAGLRLWPSKRRSEAELRARVSGNLGPQVFENVFATGSQLNRREAIALVRSLAEAEAQE
jgi:hypothetical protein